MPKNKDNITYIQANMNLFPVPSPTEFGEDEKRVFISVLTPIMRNDLPRETREYFDRLADAVFSGASSPPEPSLEYLMHEAAAMLEKYNASG